MIRRIPITYEAYLRGKLLFTRRWSGRSSSSEIVKFCMTPSPPREHPW